MVSIIRVGFKAGVIPCYHYLSESEEWRGVEADSMTGRIQGV